MAEEAAGVSVGISGVALGKAVVGTGFVAVFVGVTLGGANVRVAEGSGEGVTDKVGVELGNWVGTFGT